MELPPKSWSKVGGSVYLVNDKYSHELRELLKRFEGPEFKWCEFRVENPCPVLPETLHGRAHIDIRPGPTAHRSRGRKSF